MVTTDAYIAGVYEHPLREAPEKSVMELHADVAREALSDAGLSKSDVDGFATAGVPEYEYGYPGLIMTDYLGLDVSFINTTDVGGASYVSHVGHAADAVTCGTADVVLITQAGRPRSSEQKRGTEVDEPVSIQGDFESAYGATSVTKAALAARRHMHEYGTTSRQLAEIRVAAGYHAQYNEHALYQEPVTIEDVVDSKMVADPLHLLDCCVVTDGGGAILVVSEEVRDEIERECVRILGHGETIKHSDGGRIDPTYTGAVKSGKSAYDEAGVTPEEIDYASIYDSFTITALEIIEDLGFCDKGEGGAFVEGGTLQAPDGELPVNTDGGGLASNHPGNRGGVVKVVEAVRQLRRETNPPVQAPDPTIAVAHAEGGGSPATRHASVTLVLGGEAR